MHQWLQDKLVAGSSHDVIIFKDHGSGEVADYITIDVARKEICLYHCKAAPKHSSGVNRGEANMGATLEHVKDALDQVLRSVVWVKSRRLINRIAQRFEGDNQTFFVQGEESFSDLKSDFEPSSWTYQVCLVNPGLDQREAPQTENVNLVLLTCYEWLRGIGCDLRIMGYDPGAGNSID